MVNKLFRKGASVRPSAGRRGDAPALDLSSLGIYNVPLDNARLRQRRLRRICGLHGRAGAHLETTVTLRPTRRSISSGERRIRMFIGDIFIGYMPTMTSMLFLRQAEHWDTHPKSFRCAGVLQGGEATFLWRRRPLYLSLDLPIQMNHFPMSWRQATQHRADYPYRGD